MTNHVSGLRLLEDAFIIIDEARESLARGHPHRCVRKSQEAAELAMKACLIALGIEYPKTHSIGKVAMQKLVDRGCDESQVRPLCDVLDALAADREAAFYGTEDGKSPSELFGQSEAEAAIGSAETVLSFSKGVLGKFV